MTTRWSRGKPRPTLNAANKRRRDRNKAAKRCLNENAAGSHGPATHGVRCAGCAATHGGYPDARQEAA